MLTSLSLWGIIEITYSSLKLHPFVPHKTFQVLYGFVTSPLGIETLYEDIMLEYKAYEAFKCFIEGKCYFPHDPENVLYLYCTCSFNENYINAKKKENYLEPLEDM